LFLDVEIRQAETKLESFTFQSRFKFSSFISSAVGSLIALLLPSLSSCNQMQKKIQKLKTLNFFQIEVNHWSKQQTPHKMCI
jgi:hypothetical protein